LYPPATVKALRFPQVCAVLRIYSRPSPCCHCPFLYDDEHDTIGGQVGGTGREGISRLRFLVSAYCASRTQLRDGGLYRSLATGPDSSVGNLRPLHPGCLGGTLRQHHAVRSVPFACPEPRRAPPHPRKPSRFFPYWHEADTTEILIANPRLEFRLTAPKLSQLRISNRKKSAIFYPVFRRSAKIVLPPLFPSGRDSSPP
jgi:hypothetical protein